MQGNDAVRYEQACELLPLRLRRLARAVSDERKARTEEFRLRSGRPLTLLLPEGESAAAPTDRDGIVSTEDLEHMVDGLTEYSRYACTETIRKGYLTARGGFRIGICGTVIVREGKSCGIRDVSSLTVRIVREKLGVSDGIVQALYGDERPRSTLLLAAPGGGKTTLLRDLIRHFSLGDELHPACRVAVVDERGELAALRQGVVQMNLGNHTDVLDGCGKAEGIMMLLRAMNPQLIAVDEITEEADIRAMATAANCGVALLATIHANDADDLRRKPLFPLLCASGVFQKTVTVTGRGGTRQYEVGDMPCAP